MAISQGSFLWATSLIIKKHDTSTEDSTMDSLLPWSFCPSGHICYSHPSWRYVLSYFIWLYLCVHCRDISIWEKKIYLLNFDHFWILISFCFLWFSLLLPFPKCCKWVLYDSNVLYITKVGRNDFQCFQHKEHKEMINV